MCLNQITGSVTGNPPVSKPRESPLFVVFANRLSVRPLLRRPGSVRSPSPVAVGSRGSRRTTAARVAGGGDGGIAAARPNTRIARRPRQPRHGRCRPRHRNRNRTQRVAKPRRPTAIRYLSQNGLRTRGPPVWESTSWRSQNQARNILWAVPQFRVTRSNRFIELPGKLRQVLDGLTAENILPFDQP